MNFQLHIVRIYLHLAHRLLSWRNCKMDCRHCPLSVFTQAWWWIAQGLHCTYFYSRWTLCDNILIHVHFSKSIFVRFFWEHSSSLRCTFTGSFLERYSLHIIIHCNRRAGSIGESAKFNILVRWFTLCPSSNCLYNACLWNIHIHICDNSLLQRWEITIIFY